MFALSSRFETCTFWPWKVNLNFDLKSGQGQVKVRSWPEQVNMHIRPLENEVLIFGAALRFSHYLIHLMPIGTIPSEIDQDLDLSHRLWSLCVLVHTLKLAGMHYECMLCIRVVLFAQLFENARSHPLSDAIFNDDHDKIIKIYILSRTLGPRPHFWSNNNIAGQKL